MSRRYDLYDGVVALIVAIICIGLMGWAGLHLIRGAYGTGYIEGAQAGFAAGASDARRTVYAGCAPWGKWSDRKVVIWQETMK